MKKIKLNFLLFAIVSCSSSDDKNIIDNTANCVGNQINILENFTINKISIFTESNELIKEYTIDSKNRISKLIDNNSGSSSNYFEYIYNDCNQLITIQSVFQNQTTISKSLEYDSNGLLIKLISGGYYLEFEHNGQNVIYKEFRPSLNRKKEWTFDENNNLIKSVDLLNLNYTINFQYDSNNNFISTDYDLTYHNEKNPIHLIMNNTYSRKNNFLVNYGFDEFIPNGPFFLEEYGLAPNLIANWHETSSTSDYSTEIVQSSNGYVLKYRYLSDDNILKIIEVELN